MNVFEPVVANEAVSIVLPPLPVGNITLNVDASPLVNVIVVPLTLAVTNAKLADVNRDEVDASNPSNLLSTDVENVNGLPKPFIVDADIIDALTLPIKVTLVEPEITIISDVSDVVCC
jgi:hypothetical protein